MSTPATSTASPGKKSIKGLLVVLVITVMIILVGRFLHSGFPVWTPRVSGSSEPTPTVHSITITKGVWSEKIDTTGRRFRVVSVTPPARRMTMVNGNTNRIHHLPAGPASDINVGTDVRSHEFMIEPDETVSSSIVKYEFY